MVLATKLAKLSQQGSDQAQRAKNEPNGEARLMSQVLSQFRQDVRNWLGDNFPKSLIGRGCLLYTSPSPRDKRQSRMPSSA